ncbi:hypothetical protein D9756_003405 [Leucocoprinus leucothites]|uniref:Uncharacterized protein n=1 Tax=Leucocoprinus leucothites TaxID=201217 RepID=A0A8H5LJN9_9AGAR|nr:hypothetical protein D9756_003405 [Leucoagaricus leucothites]
MSTPNPPPVRYRFVIALPPELSPLPNASELPPVPFERDTQPIARRGGSGTTNFGPGVGSSQAPPPTVQPSTVPSSTMLPSTTSTSTQGSR